MDLRHQQTRLLREHWVAPHMFRGQQRDVPAEQKARPRPPPLFPRATIPRPTLAHTASDELDGYAAEPAVVGRLR